MLSKLVVATVVLVTAASVFLAGCGCMSLSACGPDDDAPPPKKIIKWGR